MTPEETQMLIETRNDVRWIKDWTNEHKQTHSNYLYFCFTTFVVAILGWFKS